MEFLILLVIILAAATKNVSAVQPKPGCQTRCGNVSIPYPFGIETGCFMEDKFSIACSSTDNNVSFTPVLLLKDIPYEVLDISIDGHLRIKGTVATVAVDCYTRSDHFKLDAHFSAGQHYISHTRNKFIAIGCNTIGVIRGFNGKQYKTGCTASCKSITEVTNGMNGSCSNIGCCQLDILRELKSYNISLDSNHSLVLSFNRCGYGFIAEDGAYNFSGSDLIVSPSETMLTKNELPMVLNWRIGHQNCSEARKDPENYACQENTICQDTGFGNGYSCSCVDGFQGNPYLTNGCQDIDECETLKPCNSTCHNTFGSFKCSCTEGYEGDGLRNGTGCSPKVDLSDWRQIVAGVIIGVLSISLIIIACFWVYIQIKKFKLREKYFNQNGGFLFRKQLAEQEGCGENVKLFTDEELKKATNNYHESTILGQGGQGTVYRGILSDNRMVAIKISRIGVPSQVEPFVNEIIMLCQINHRNVVKLLGCCFETQVPTLVYEFVNNGTLFDHMHNAVAVADADAAACSFLPWEARLTIATETAEAISYLHSAASVPIIHRDIKLANILLDKNYTAKVSDFGASRFFPSDQAGINTIVQGTFGYLDPEYMQTSVLTEKSDVYSFGVVLIELLTGEKVLSFERSEEKRVLPMYFVSLMKEDRLIEILDPRVVKNENLEQLKAVAAVARQCVSVKGEERPTMKDVAHELAGLRATNIVEVAVR